jgi:hypothetical protein
MTSILTAFNLGLIWFRIWWIRRAVSPKRVKNKYNQDPVTRLVIAIVESGWSVYFLRATQDN